MPIVQWSEVTVPAGAAGSVEIQALIDAYVDRLRESGAIRTDAVENAFRAVPRHRLVERFFVPNKLFSSQAGYREVIVDPEDPKRDELELIYSHNALVTRLGEYGRPTSSTSMPALVAQMLELLRLEPGQRVLEVGAGTGYNAALISEVVRSQEAVVSVDIQADVADQARRLLAAVGYGGIRVVTGDGFYGVPEGAPYDRLVATVGLFDISPHWCDQLSPAGEMLLPIYQGGAAPLLRVRKRDGSLVGRVVGRSGFMPIEGEMAGPERRATRSGSDTDAEVVWLDGWELGPDRSHFWFFLTACDERARLLPLPGADDGDTWSRWTFGLSDDSSRVVIGVDRIALVGDATELLERLKELRERWESEGRPAAHMFDIEFIPCSAIGTSLKSDLSIQRKYHQQRLFLRPSPAPTA